MWLGRHDDLAWWSRPRFIRRYRVQTRKSLVFQESASEWTSQCCFAIPGCLRVNKCLPYLSLSPAAPAEGSTICCNSALCRTSRANRANDRAKPSSMELPACPTTPCSRTMASSKYCRSTHPVSRAAAADFLEAHLLGVLAD